MDDFIKIWNQLAEIIGSIVRPLGGLALGSVIGWLLTSTFLDSEKEWQLKIAVFLGVLGAFVCLHIYSGPGTTGAFALGAGVAAIVLGLRSAQATKKK